MSALIKAKRPTVASQLAAMQADLAEIKSRLVSDHTRPLSAAQLCDRWNVAGESVRRKLINLGRMCERRGLKQLKGPRGWNATYALADVVGVEKLAKKA